MARATGAARSAPPMPGPGTVQLVLPIPPREGGGNSEEPSLTSEATLAIRRAAEFAEDRGDPSVTAVHLLLALLVDPSHVAAIILARHEIGATGLSSRLIALLPPADRTRGRPRSDDSAELEMVRRWPRRKPSPPAPPPPPPATC